MTSLNIKLIEGEITKHKMIFILIKEVKYKHHNITILTSKVDSMRDSIVKRLGYYDTNK